MLKKTELRGDWPSFQQIMNQKGLELKRMGVETLQVNIGKLCNQACHHCHVEAGPSRTELMTKSTMERLLELIDKSGASIETVDITGGAPEMNPDFRFFVKELRKRDIQIIDRCNLTVLFEKDQADTAEFLAQHQVHVMASLPCYSKDNVEKQRGRGVFNKSIEALKLLNSLGYARVPELHLDLIYNPVGAHLPPEQDKLEQDYKSELKNLFNIEFNNLYAITNLPVKRYLEHLRRSGELESYMNLLVNSFNPQAFESVMCKNLISVSWDGQIYDCDFNQMLELSPSSGKTSLWSIKSLDEFKNTEISVEDHCYGCTAGSGSSCGGTLVS